MADRSERRGTGVYLGIIPEYSKAVEGVLLAGVTAGSPAAAAGLREGDVIVQLADKKISNIQELTSALGTYRPAAEVTIVVQRSDGTSALKTTLGARP
jgi:S1-C subfamily serine protease